MPDGSIIYYKSYNDMTPEEVNSLAAENCVYGIPRACEYDTISRDTVEKFEKFIEYLQNKGIKVIFFLPSFHSYYIDYVINTVDKYRSLWQTEKLSAIWAKSTALRCTAVMTEKTAIYPTDILWMEYI